MEVTFEGESTFPQTPQPTFSTDISIQSKNDTKTTEGRTEELRLKKIVQDQNRDKNKKSTTSHQDKNSFHLYKESIEVSMHAELMIEQDLLLSEDVKQEEKFRFKTKNVSNVIPPKNQIIELEGTTWMKKHELDATRRLQCTFAHTKRKCCYVKMCLKIIICCLMMGALIFDNIIHHILLQLL